MLLGQGLGGRHERRLAPVPTARSIACSATTVLPSPPRHKQPLHRARRCEVGVDLVHGRQLVAGEHERQLLLAPRAAEARRVRHGRRAQR